MKLLDYSLVAALLFSAAISTDAFVPVAMPSWRHLPVPAAPMTTLEMNLLSKLKNKIPFCRRSSDSSSGSRDCSSLSASRTPFISGNWKLNPTTKEEASNLASAIANSITSSSPNSDVALFVPYLFIESAMNAAGGKLQVGAEACFYEGKGAYTGAISTGMLKSIGVQWSLAGHSERRVVFNESNEDINKQCLTLIQAGMSVMLCIGELEEEFDLDLAAAVCEVQLKKGLAGISKEDMDRVAIAYEPVWAIGTGKVATPEIAQSVHSTCRSILAKIYDQETADKTRILYGGSVTPDSVDDLMRQPDIDGALVGGASLDAGKFGRIINFQA